MVLLLPLSFGTAGREEAREAERLAWLAARLGTDDATALCVAGFVIAEIARDFDTGMAMVSRALALNPNLVTAWFLGGWVRVINGEPDVAIEHFAHAERLSPFDPFIFAVHAGIANAHFFAGRDDQALSAAEHCLRDMPNYLPALWIVAASSAPTGATDRARMAIARIRELNPGKVPFRIQETDPVPSLGTHCESDRGPKKGRAPGVIRAGAPPSLRAAIFTPSPNTS